MPEVKTFVSAIVQADRLGLPIGSVLREQAKEMRLVRRQRAEEKAQKVPVKILFPMLFCIFPALMVVVIGPGIIRIMGCSPAVLTGLSDPPGRTGKRAGMRGAPPHTGASALCRAQGWDLTNPSLIAAMTALARLWAPSLE